MKEISKTEIKVGLTVLIGLIIFLWIFGWAKNISLRSNENFVKVKFNNVGGLEIGDPVTINGLRKGYIDDIEIENNVLIVEAAIDKDVKLKEDAIFSIVMLDLMGGKKLEVFPGTSESEIDFNKVHNGIFQSDIPSVIASIGSMQNDIVFVLNEMKLSLTFLNQLISDKSFSSDMKLITSNFKNLSEQINNLILENRSEISLIAKNTAELTANANSLIDENKDSLKILLNNFNSLSNKLTKLVETMNSFSEQIENKKNNLGKILYDEELMGNLMSSIKQLNILTKLLIEQLNAKGIKVDANIF